VLFETPSGFAIFALDGLCLLLPGACNTQGVCHQLSSGFELKHGRLSGNEDVKVKPMEASLNLNLDVAPLLYI
jgi:hypothetical protein